MKVKQLPLAIIAVILMFSACKKPPEASFTHSSDNYEEGDTVNFISTSTDANSLDWDFGDGSTSTDESPMHIYNSTGTYTVSLTATNDDGSDEASESVTIKDPTILAFFVTEGQSETVITNCGVMLFETEDDLYNLENIKAGGYTDSDGYIDFYHAKPIVYYLYAFKEVANGTWFFVGSTNVIDPNEMNLYIIPCELVTSKKSGIQITPEMVKSLDRSIE
ncbi:MAG: PKD domain-containing protein [Bacteroidales bacterium]|nr:PKD domain-containing protein [Bacteroidales bacterium]